MNIKSRQIKILYHLTFSNVTFGENKKFNKARIVFPTYFESKNTYSGKENEKRKTFWRKEEKRSRSRRRSFFEKHLARELGLEQLPPPPHTKNFDLLAKGTEKLELYESILPRLSRNLRYNFLSFSFFFFSGVSIFAFLFFFFFRNLIFIFFFCISYFFPYFFSSI